MEGEALGENRHALYSGHMVDDAQWSEASATRWGVAEEEAAVGGAACAYDASDVALKLGDEGTQLAMWRGPGAIAYGVPLAVRLGVERVQRSFVRRVKLEPGATRLLSDVLGDAPPEESEEMMDGRMMDAAGVVGVGHVGQREQ